MGQAAERLSAPEDGRLLRLHDRPAGFNPMEFPIGTRTPKRYAVPSAWLGHAPFAMTLVAMLRPRVVVELGTHWGVSYCAFCQAVKELGLDARCYAVDTWEGDAQSHFYGAEVLADLRAHHDPEYALFSELIPAWFDDALPRFDDASIDLLHIDGFHSYEAVRHDFAAWLPKLSDRGVVLFHDIHVRDREDFGVWRFWDEVRAHHPHFAFEHAHGLGVLAVGESIPAGLRPLLGADGAEAARIREHFRNLGDRLAELFEATIGQYRVREQFEAAEARAEALRAEAEAARAEAEAARAEGCARLARESDRLAEELAALRAEHAATLAHYGQLRFRAVDRVASRLSRYPRAYVPLRGLARIAAAAWKAARSRP